MKLVVTMSPPAVFATALVGLAIVMMETSVQGFGVLNHHHHHQQQQRYTTNGMIPNKYRTIKTISSSPLVPSHQPMSSSLFPSKYYPTTTPTTTTTALSMAAMGGKTYEQLLEKLPSSSVITAVSEVSDGQNRVVASDIATKAGVSLSQARKDLTTLAGLTRGDISVSADGDLVYQFPSNVQGVLASNSAKFQAIQTFEKIWPTLFWGIRVSFGVALLASVVLIFSTIFFIQTSSSSDDRDDRRSSNDRGGGGFGGGMPGGMGFWGPSPFDFFYYRPYGYYGYYGTPIPGQDSSYKDPEEMGFFESIFSYIFGDGNPNQGLEEKRLALVAQMIRNNNGAVTAEQLAPYCDPPNDDPTSVSSSNYIDESFVLPIVTQLDGEPRVTEDGDIVYVFPELQVSATSSTTALSSSSSSSSSSRQILKRAGLPSNASAREIQQLLYMNGISSRGELEKKDLLRILEQALPPMTKEEEDDDLLDDPTLLQEREFQFSLAPDLYKFFAGALGVVNLGGALYLGNLLGQYAAYGVQLPSYFGVVQSFYPLLLGYAVLFNVIPIFRRLYNGSQNAQIQQRNSIRKQWRTQLQNKAGTIGRKLQAAAKFATQRKQLQAEDMIYDTQTTTAKDIQREATKKEMEEFDKQLLGESMDATIPSSSPTTTTKSTTTTSKLEEEEPFQ